MAINLIWGDMNLSRNIIFEALIDIDTSNNQSHPVKLVNQVTWIFWQSKHDVLLQDNHNIMLLVKHIITLLRVLTREKPITKTPIMIISSSSLITPRMMIFMSSSGIKDMYSIGEVVMLLVVSKLIVVFKQFNFLYKEMCMTDKYLYKDPTVSDICFSSKTSSSLTQRYNND